MTEHEVDVLHEERDITIDGFYLGFIDIQGVWLIDEDGAAPIGVRLRDARDHEVWLDVPRSSPLFQPCIEAIKGAADWVLDTHRCDDLPTTFDPHREWAPRVI